MSDDMTSMHILVFVETVDLRDEIERRLLDAISRIDHPEDQSGIRRANYYSRQLAEADRILRRMVGGEP